MRVDQWVASAGGAACNVSTTICSTVSLWRTRFAEHGVEGLAEVRGEPATARRRGRPLAALELGDHDLAVLARWTRRHSVSQALAQRARIVLGAAEGAVSYTHLTLPTTPYV